jgi:transposase
MARHEVQRRWVAGLAAVVGVDAGKFAHALAVQRADGTRTTPLMVPTTRAGFDTARAALVELTAAAPPAQVLVAIEFAGYYGFTFAHYLHACGYPVVSVLPAHTKRFKDVVHGQPLKSDPKDAQTIAELATQGFYVRFPFLAPPYARLRYLVSGRERLSLQRRSLINRLRMLLQVTWPEYEQVFPHLTKRTPFELLAAFPGPAALLAAPRARVLTTLRHASRGHHAGPTLRRLLTSARETLGLPGAQSALTLELGLLLAQYRLYAEQMAVIEAAMVDALAPLPEAACLQTIPLVAPVTAAVFLGSIGDPRAYHSAHEILRVAGLSLVTRQSGRLVGRTRVSKRGRPALRQHAYMFAVRSIRQGGLFRAEYERLLARGKAATKKKAVVAVSRSGLKLLWSIARDQRVFTPQPPQRGGGPRSLA